MSNENEIKLEPSPEQGGGIMSDSQFRVGFDRDNDPNVMVINIPLLRCAEDLEEGSALLRGKFDEAKQVALKMIVEKRTRKKMATTLARPGLVPPMMVH